jgi:hypothetical protein
METRSSYNIIGGHYLRDAMAYHEARIKAISQLVISYPISIASFKIQAKDDEMVVVFRLKGIYTKEFQD